MPYRIFAYALGLLAISYAIFFATSTFPIERRNTPYSFENTNPEKRFPYYIITNENNDIELMRVLIRVHIGDEVLSEDNKLYQVIRIENNHAYAKFIKQVKL